MQIDSSGGEKLTIPDPVEILGVPIAPLTLERLLELCTDAVRLESSLVLGVVNVAKLVTMQEDRPLREAVLASDVILADGMGVVWGSRVLGRALPERVAGIDIFEDLLAAAEERGHSVYLLGARESVLEDLLKELAQRHPGLRIAGSRNGYFDESEEAGIVAGIRASGADFLFLGMSSPKKELFLARWGRELAVPVCHGVGGSFDVMAGFVRRAPPLWQKLGLEWLYRLVQEPRRLFWRYASTNTRYAWLILRSLLGSPPRWR